MPSNDNYNIEWLESVRDATEQYGRWSQIDRREQIRQLQNAYRELHVADSDTGERETTMSAFPELVAGCATEWSTTPTVAGASRELSEGFPESQTRYIHNYSYRPYPAMCEIEGEYPSYYFGLEIEAESNVDDNNDLARRVMGNETIIYCKRDSSIANGFELVTHPISWGYAKENIRDNGSIRKILSRASKFGMRSFKTSTCGMHIHISQEAFAGTIHLYKFLRLIYKNKRFTKRMARRAGRRINEWASLETRPMTVEQMAEEKRSVSRHVAVNLNNNDTFEVRIFRGTLNPDSVMMNICFVRSLIEYTRDAPLDEYSLKGYKEYVRQNPAEYIELLDKIK